MAKRREVDFPSSVDLPVRVVREGNLFVATCPPLDVTSQGRTRASALRNVIEALQAFLTTCHETGTLSDVLRQCGLDISSAGARLPVYTAQPTPDDLETVTVPLPLAIVRSVADSCRG